MIASIAAGWVLDEARQEVQAGLLAIVESWRAGANQPSFTLWNALAAHLRRCGCLEAEADLLRTALSLDPDMVIIQLRLAESLHAMGESAEARDVLGTISEPILARIDALILLVGIATDLGESADASVEELKDLLLRQPHWSGRHSKLTRHLIRLKRRSQAADFMAAWTQSWPVAPENLMDLGALAMLAGQPAKARHFFGALWSGQSGDLSHVLGQFSGTVPPFDSVLEQSLLSRIEDAFCEDETHLTAMPPPDFGPVPDDIRVCMVSFAHRALPNDMSEHLAGAAHAAEVNLDLYLDTVLVLPDDVRMPHGEMDGRVAAFASYLARTKPHVIILDCCSPLRFCGLNPGIMVDLKERFGFRLVCLMRDAHSGSLPGLQAWLPACDTMVIFDPQSPILHEEFAPANGKVLVLPVPAMHSHFLERGPRDNAMTFIGSVNFAARQAFLSVLLTEDINFKAITGDERSADTRAYAQRLTGAGAVLNISIHTPTEHLITGRVWETIAAGALLVEQSNGATPRLFTPYRHYLPWENVADIVQICRFMERHPEVVRRIADEGHAWASRHYGAARFWNALLGHALLPTHGRDLAADHRAARAWHEVTIG